MLTLTNLPTFQHPASVKASKGKAGSEKITPPATPQSTPPKRAKPGLRDNGSESDDESNPKENSEEYQMIEIRSDNEEGEIRF